MWISTAYAAGAGGAPGSGDAFFMQMLLIGVLFLIFWLLVIRPSQKKMADHKSMVEAIRRGDKIVTAGGIIGTVTKVLDDDEVQVEIAENVRIKVVQTTIQLVLSKSEPAKGEKGKDAKEKADDKADK
ncbi:MAG: preprotein translocase subunit YajC [Alphaproteobacteria bacterium]|nr:preprotein translocase subunit YajC [Alphaproteobacteria bacterium SS10]